jgi:uncharacterized YccA/Bax inhibitor family protein
MSEVTLCSRRATVSVSSVSTQVLNEQTFAPKNVQRVMAGRPLERTMTVGGAAAKSFLLLFLVIGFAVIGWNYALRVVATTSGVLFLIGYVVLVALTFAAVSNPRIAPLLGFVYAVLMGTWMGAISRVYEQFYDGIVGQAIFASLCVFGACLVLYGMRIVKVTRRFLGVVVGATLGVALLYAVALLLSLFGIDLRFLTEPTPLGIAVSLGICLVAALNLILDFAVIEGGAAARAPREMEWLAAFGLVSTLVWLYLEVLRLLALLAPER